jgi:hypothetical protein
VLALLLALVSSVQLLEKKGMKELELYKKEQEASDSD